MSSVCLLISHFGNFSSLSAPFRDYTIEQFQNTLHEDNEEDKRDYYDRDLAVLSFSRKIDENPSTSSNVMERLECSCDVFDHKNSAGARLNFGAYMLEEISTCALD